MSNWSNCYRVFVRHKEKKSDIKNVDKSTKTGLFLQMAAWEWEEWVNLGKTWSPDYYIMTNYILTPQTSPDFFVHNFTVSIRKIKCYFTSLKATERIQEGPKMQWLEDLYSYVHPQQPKSGSNPSVQEQTTK